MNFQIKFISIITFLEGNWTGKIFVIFFKFLPLNMSSIFINSDCKIRMLTWNSWSDFNMVYSFSLLLKGFFKLLKSLASFKCIVTNNMQYIHMTKKNMCSWDQADELKLCGPKNVLLRILKKTWIIITLNVSFMKFSCILIFHFLQYYEAVKRKNADTKCKMIALFQKIYLKSIFRSGREDAQYSLGKILTLYFVLQETGFELFLFCF